MVGAARPARTRCIYGQPDGTFAFDVADDGVVDLVHPMATSNADEAARPSAASRPVRPPSSDDRAPWTLCWTSAKSSTKG